MHPTALGTVFLDRKSTRLNSSHLVISYAGFCLKKANVLGVFDPAGVIGEVLVNRQPRRIAWDGGCVVKLAVIAKGQAMPQHVVPDEPGRGVGERVIAEGVTADEGSEEHTSELQSPCNLVCRLLLGKEEHTSELKSPCNIVCRLPLEKKKKKIN